MKISDEKYGFYAAIVFLVWPLLAVFSAFWNYRSNWAKNMLWAFVAFYGFAFAIGSESAGSDINRYIEQLQDLHTVELNVHKATEYFEESGEVDVLRTFIAVTLSRLTDSQAILTLVYGIIFGFFFSRNIWYVLDRLKGKMQLITILLLVCFFLVIPIWNINGFRMWTAAHIFIYGLLPYLFEGNKKKLLISISSVLVHFSFIVPVFVLLGYIMAGNRLVIYFCFFALTFFISEINLEVFNNVIESYAPEVIQERTISYRSEAKVASFRSQSGGNQPVWYARLYGVALRWSIMGFLVMLFIKGKDFFRQHKGWLSLFSFTLLFNGAANLLSSLPSGGRFLSIANMLALAVIILYVQNRPHEVVMKRFILFATPALLLFVLVAFRIGLYSMSATSILGNPIIAWFLMGEHISMNEFLKSILG